MKPEATLMRTSNDAAKPWMAVAKHWPSVAMIVAAFLWLSVPVLGQGTTFTYQGRLQDGGAAANGSYDFQFTLWDSLIGGTQQPPAGPVTVTRVSVPVANGVFTTQLDFGATAFPGADRFLEISVRLAGGGAFTILAPRQPITSTPYAIRATNATQLGGVAATQYVQTNDSRLTDSRPPTSGSSNYIQNTALPQAASNFNISGNGLIGGNVGIGTGSPMARLHVAGGDVVFENKWRTETTTVNPGAKPGPPNLIGGFLGTGGGGATPGNRVTPGVVGATIGGGGFNGSIDWPSGGNFGGDNSNRVTDWFGTVGGGWRNRAGNDDATLDNARMATVAGGLSNTASGWTATVGGGTTNTASGTSATVGGGYVNIASGSYATVGGGITNTASGDFATVPGGESNNALGLNSFAAGRRANANHQGTFVWADSNPNFTADFRSTGNDQFLIRAAGGVGIGTNAPTNPFHVVGSFNDNGGVPANHVALIQNTSNGTSADVLALKIARADSPGSGNNFITFFKGDDTTAGSIEGNGIGGVQLSGPGNDYAEWLPRLDPKESIQPGEVVGVFNGKISKATNGASQVMVMSTGAIVAGNDPGTNGRATHSLVAFIGQANVRVRGAVQAGDLIVPSGQEDGVGLAVSPEKITAEQFAQVLGQAWETSANSGIKQVRVAVGLMRHDPTVKRLLTHSRQQAAQLAAMEARLDELQQQIEQNAELPQQNTALEARLAALEQMVQQLKTQPERSQPPRQ